MKTIYIAWAGYQRRAVSMRSHMGFGLYHFPPKDGNIVQKFMGYVSQCIQTVKAIHREAPDSVWIQVPPNFVPHIVFVYRFVWRSQFKIIIDCHNAALRAPWLSIPFFREIARLSDAVVVHNEFIAESARSIMESSSNIIVLEDPPSIFGSSASGEAGDFILVPCSFHDDEPIDVVLDAARIAQNINFKITGNIAKAIAKGFVANAPSNVVFTGFVSEEEFNELLFSASLVIGITTFEGIQLSVASEAIGAGKALALSETVTLKSMFSDCANFFLNTPSDLARVVNESVRDRALLEARSRSSSSERAKRWKAKVGMIDGVFQ